MGPEIKACLVIVLATQEEAKAVFPYSTEIRNGKEGTFFFVTYLSCIPLYLHE